MPKYYVQYNVGRAKYVLSYHLEGKTHKDGSEFYDIRIFTNRKSMEKFIKSLSPSLDTLNTM